MARVMIDDRDVAAQRATHTIELHIEELVLHGFPPADHHSIGGAVERELTRLLVGSDTPPGLASGGEVARLDGGAFDVAPNAAPEVIGAQIAQAIYSGLSR